MKLKIDYNKLTDSPYDKNDVDNVFLFTGYEVNDLVNSLNNFKEGCYYISGYRGVGKTSFIKKVEEELANSVKSKEGDFIFVHVNISKFDKYEIIIRNFIRQFYFKTKNPGAKDLSKEQVMLKLEILHSQTFYNIESEKIHSNSKEETVGLSYSINFAQISLFIVSLAAFILSWFYTNGIENIWVARIIKVSSFVWVLIQSIEAKLNFSTVINEKRENINTEKSFYDDEIAEHKFNEVLKEFKSNKVKIVFVIDELDKLDNDDAKKILHLLKSTLLSGNANFIIIGGQHLQNEFYESEYCEDTILSTLFSKKMHISLKSSSEFRLLFDNLILNKEETIGEEKAKALKNYIDSLIIKSRKVPRKFINLIKESIEWENSDAIIFIDDNLDFKNSDVLDCIDEIVEVHSLSGSKANSIDDFYQMAMLIEGPKLLEFSNKEKMYDHIDNLIIK